MCAKSKKENYNGDKIQFLNFMMKSIKHILKPHRTLSTFKDTFLKQNVKNILKFFTSGQNKFA